MPFLTLEDFERDVLGALTTYATIPCISPAYDAQWAQNGHIDDAVELLASWARARRMANFNVTVHRLEGRTPVLVITVDPRGVGDRRCDQRR